MRTRLFCAVACAAALTVIANPCHASKAIKWAPSWKTALEKARSSNALIMVDFYIEGCVFCQRLDRETFTDDHVIQASENLVPVKLDAEREGRAVAQRYRKHIGGYPTILFVNVGGEVEGRIGGFLPPDHFAPELRKYLVLHVEFPKVEARYRSGDRSAATLAMLAWAYAGRGNGNKAETLLAEAEKESVGKVTAELAKAYNAVGDYHQFADRFDTAVGYFRKAAKTNDPAEKTYALISIASCYITDKRPRLAIPALKALVSMPKATPAYKKQAEEMLKQVEGGR